MNLASEVAHYIADVLGYVFLIITFITLSAVLPDLICAAWRKLHRKRDAP